MAPISVPFAPTSYKIVCGIPLLTLAALAFYWGTKNLRLCISMLQGRSPLPPRGSPPFVVLGVVFYLVVLAVGVGATVFFLALTTTQPTIVSQDGLLVGAGPPRYRQKFVPWNDITLVTCNLPPRENRVRLLTFYSRDTVIGLGDAGVTLEGVLKLATQQAPRGTVRPCEHRAMSNSWSY